MGNEVSENEKVRDIFEHLDFDGDKEWNVGETNEWIVCTNKNPDNLPSYFQSLRVRNVTLDTLTQVYQKAPSRYLQDDHTALFLKTKVSIDSEHTLLSVEGQDPPSVSDCSSAQSADSMTQDLASVSSQSDSRFSDSQSEHEQTSTVRESDTCAYVNANLV